MIALSLTNDHESLLTDRCGYESPENSSPFELRRKGSTKGVLLTFYYMIIIICSYNERNSLV